MRLSIATIFAVVATIAAQASEEQCITTIGLPGGCCPPHSSASETVLIDCKGAWKWDCLLGQIAHTASRLLSDFCHNWHPLHGKKSLGRKPILWPGSHILRRPAGREHSQVYGIFAEVIPTGLDALPNSSADRARHNDRHELLAFFDLRTNPGVCAGRARLRGLHKDHNDSQAVAVHSHSSSSYIHL